jgi:hypothetical protein
MRKKIIFIDVDGPLAWATWHDGKVTISTGVEDFQIPYPWVKEDCEALQTICDETNAELVVSSDWKKHFTFNQLKSIFRHYGITARLIDITTHQDLWNKMSRPSIQHERALEVAKWAKDNKITNWIAIDDLDLYNEFKWLTPKVSMWRHVQVDGDHGVGGRLRDKIEECINKLNR